MLTRLKLQRGEGKILVSTPEVMHRRRRAKRAQYPPKVPIPPRIETPQVLPSIDIEEVQAISEIEPESIAIMSGAR